MITAALVAALGLAAIAMPAAIGFALSALSSRNEREAARVLASSTAGELVRARDAIATLTANLKIEQERADALDVELARCAENLDPDGARLRVLRRWQADRANARGGTLALPASPATKPAHDPDALINPFNE